MTIITMAQDGRATKQGHLWRGGAQQAETSVDWREIRQWFHNEIKSVVLRISDESSGLLSYTSLCQSWPSVWKYSSFPSTLPSGETSTYLFASHGSLPGGQSCDWQLPPTHLGARVNVWLIWGGVIGCACPFWWMAFWAPVSVEEGGGSLFVFCSKLELPLPTGLFLSLLRCALLWLWRMKTALKRL